MITKDILSKLSPNSIVVLLSPILSEDKIEAALLELSPNEKSRAANLLVSRRSAFVSARLLLRRLLKSMGVTNSNSIELQEKGLGKPYFETLKFEFSISHTADLAGLAFSESTELGFDLETNRKLENANALGERFLQKKNLEVFRQLRSVDDKESFFLNYWCLLESKAKYLASSPLRESLNLNPKELKPQSWAADDELQLRLDYPKGNIIQSLCSKHELQVFQNWIEL